MAIGQAILTDAGLQALNDAHTNGTTVKPKYFKFSNSSYRDGGGIDLDGTVTDITGWYEHDINAYQQMNLNTVEFMCECPVESASDTCQTVGLYLDDDTLYMLAEPPSPIPQGVRQIVKVQLIFSDVGTILDFQYIPVTSFTDLTDTPSSFAGTGAYRLKVNPAGTAIVFVDDTLLNLNDTPTSYSGLAGKAVIVKQTEDGVEFGDVSTVGDFLDLNDTPDTYTGQAGKIPVVNSAEDGIEFVTNSTAMANARVIDFFYDDSDTVISDGAKEPTRYMPYGGTIKKIVTRCTVGSGTVSILINGSNATQPELVNATVDSSASGGFTVVSLATPQTFSVGDTFQMSVVNSSGTMRNISVSLFINITSKWS